MKCPHPSLLLKGKGHPWKQLSWEETQSVTVLTRNAPENR